MNLEYQGVPEKNVAAFAEGVLATLEPLGYEFDYDETSPPSAGGLVTYRVVGVRLNDAAVPPMDCNDTGPPDDEGE